MIAKNGKKLIIEKYNNLNVVFGTVDNKNPKSMYINISGWASPLNENIGDYQSVINSITKKVKNQLFLNVDESLFHTNKMIVDFDMRESGIRFGRKSYMNCEVTLFQKNDYKMQNTLIQESLNDIIEVVLEEVFNKSNHFKFTRNK
tara:strand:+ start:28106 stop:28543 length:438 start_codon:yes stop_codon:yes gene_type:complete